MIVVPTLKTLQTWSQQWQQSKKTLELESYIKTYKKAEKAKAVLRGDQSVSEKKGLFHQGESTPCEKTTAKTDVGKLGTSHAAISQVVTYEVSALKHELNAALEALGFTPPWVQERSDSGLYQTDDEVLIPLTLRLLDNLLMMKERWYHDFTEKSLYYTIFYGCVSPLSKLLFSHRTSTYEVQRSAYHNALDEYIDVLTERILEARENFLHEYVINELSSEKTCAMRKIKDVIREHLVDITSEDSLNAIDAKMTEKIGVFSGQIGEENFFIASLETDDDMITINIQTTLCRCIGTYHREKRVESYLDDCYTLAFRKADTMSDDELSALFQRVLLVNSDKCTPYPLLRLASVSMIRRAYAANQCGGIFSDSKMALYLACKIQSYACLYVLMENKNKVDIEVEEHVFKETITSRDPDVIKACCEILECISWVGPTSWYSPMMEADQKRGCTRSNESRSDILMRYVLDVNKKMLSKVTIHACSCRDNAFLNKMIDAEVDLNAIDSNGRTVLMLACIEGREDVVSKLLEAKVDINVSDKSGRTALMYACDKGSVLNVSNLLDVNAAINLVDEYGKTALIHACLNTNPEIVSRLLEANVDIDVKDNSGRTALMYTCDKGSVLNVSNLLDANAAINLADEDGKTALMIACIEGHVEVVSKLLVGNAEVDLADEDGKTALIYACLNATPDSLIWRSTEIVSQVLETKDDLNVTKRMHAFSGSHEKIVFNLLEAKVGINLADKDGKTALMHACDQFSISIINVSRLLNAGVDINVVDNDGNTVFDIIGKYGHKEIRRLLENARLAEDETSRPAYSF